VSPLSGVFQAAHVKPEKQPGLENDAIKTKVILLTAGWYSRFSLPDRDEEPWRRGPARQLARGQTYVRVKGKLLDIVDLTDQKHCKTPIIGSSLGGAGLSERENPENEALCIPLAILPTYWSQCSGPAKKL
jgi:hypothetical protein